MLRKLWYRYKANRFYRRDLDKYLKGLEECGGIPVTKKNPQIYDRFGSAGNVDEHYFLQDIFVASKISGSGCRVHYDIGSRINGFLGHLLANTNLEEIVMIDIRPFPYKIPKLKFVQGDATNLNTIPDNSIQSLSCLHAVEHFGLGRYGDPVDPLACFKAMKAMQRVLSPGGVLYLSCPITVKDECHFNAHRIFSTKTIEDQFNELELIEFSVIHDMTLSTYDAKELGSRIQNNELGLGPYDCGIFIFRKSQQNEKEV